MEDHLFYRVFMDFPEPICIVQAQKNIIVWVNDAYVTLTGYPQQELLAGKYPLEKFVYKRDLKNISARLLHMESKQYLRDQIRLLTKERILKDAEVVIRKIEAPDEFFIWCLRDIGSHKELERELRSKIAQEKEKVIATAKDIMCMNALWGKLHFLPLFFQELYQLSSIEKILSTAVNLLCHNNGFHCANAAIFLREGNFLHLGYSSRECALRRFNLSKQHRFAQVARNERKIIAETTGEYVLPIISAQGLEGILQVFFQESERVLLVDNKYLKKAYWNLLEAIANFLGLLLCQLRLLEQQKQKARTDDLTGHYNHRYFAEKLRDYCVDEQNFALSLLEIDDFSKIALTNTDRLLQIFSSILTLHMPKNSIISRIRDSQFAILLPESNLNEANLCIARLQRKMEYYVRRAGEESLVITISAAVTYRTVAVDAPQVLWEQLLSCLHQAKICDGNKIFYWHKKACEFAQRPLTKL